MSKHLKRLAWFERRVSLWQQDAERLGMTVDEVAALQERLGQARECFEQRRAAAVAARVAAAEFELRATTALRAGLRLVSHIRAAAEADPGVWDLAGIQPSARLGRAPDPPTDVRAEVDADGLVVVLWESKYAGRNGASFVLERRLADRAGYRFLGMTSLCRFRDATVPPHARCGGFVCYRVLVRRGARISDYSIPFLLRLGDEEDVAAAA
jgi:hypothetical protein